ncbi:hypothetical protein [Dongia mobilis]|nr:hypothetical protein [Dongia mobilis]
MSAAELRFCDTIREKDRRLRLFLANSDFPASDNARDWLAYLIGIKSALGNINNDLGFVATLLIKQYLEQRFGIVNFDAAGKAQGASGVDIEAVSADGLSIVGELKTTKPYQPGFGAAQRTQIIKDLTRLAAYKADYRFMFVVDEDAFAALCRPSLSGRAPGVEVVDLVTGKSFVCPGT